MTRNKGFSIVEVVIVLAIVGVIGLIGWRVWDANQNNSVDQEGTSQSGSEASPDIQSDTDLDKADQTLDTMNVEGTESKELDSQTSF